MKRYNIFLSILFSFACCHAKLSALNRDSLKIQKPPRHYFNTTIYADVYRTGTRYLDQNKEVAKKLQSYQIRQLSLGFNVPVVTKDFYNKDSTQVSNIHLLLTGSYLGLSPNFAGIPAHHLSMTSIGFRGLYNTGKRGIFFAEFSPFVTRDRGYAYTRTTRLATTLLYNFAVNQYFSFRVGYTRSFMWGNRYHLPYIGIRVGRLDRINFSVQFPRSITFTVPIGNYIKTSLYTRPQGGLYSFANVDSLYTAKHDRVTYFGRYEFLSGLRIDILPSKFFNFYLSSGLTTQNYIAFFSKSGNKSNKGVYDTFYRERISGSIFVNFGLVFRLGRTRSIYNNQQMYNAIDMNNGLNIDNVKPGNGNIPRPAKKIRNVKPADVQDLIDAQDLY